MKHQNSTVATSKYLRKSIKPHRKNAFVCNNQHIYSTRNIQKSLLQQYEVPIATSQNLYCNLPELPAMAAAWSSYGGWRGSPLAEGSRDRGRAAASPPHHHHHHVRPARCSELPAMVATWSSYSGWCRGRRGVAAAGVGVGAG